MTTFHLLYLRTQMLLLISAAFQITVRDKLRVTCRIFIFLLLPYYKSLMTVFSFLTYHSSLKGINPQYVIAKQLLSLYIFIQIMKRSLPHGKMQETITKGFKSTSKNTLAQRLFDAPGMRSGEQRRPRVFSNEVNQSKLTPTIVKQYQSKKLTQGEILPPIETNSRKGRVMTEQAQPEYFENQRIANIRKNWLQQPDKNATINQVKAKQAFNRTRHIESRMNRTLTESRHVIQLMDKMKGQFPTDKPKMSRVETQPPEPKPEMREIERFKEPSKLTQRDMAKGKKDGAQSGLLSLQNSKEIDLFIFMAEDGKIPDYEFYYMIKQESNDYYNMDIVTYQTVMRKKMTQYYTLSGHGVTRYEDSRPIQFIGLSEWDAERRQFNELKELQFFKKFRKWKTLKKWITILSRNKLKRISDILSESLFVLNEQYRSILLAHHNICYDIEQFKCLYVPTEPLTITNFRKEQEKKKNSLIFSLKQCSKEMHKNSAQKLKNVVQELKSQVLGGEQMDDKDDKQTNLDEKIEAFVQLGFSSNISFGHRSTVRSQFMRFLRLAYLLDFLAVDSLGRMVMESLHNYMDMLYGGKLMITSETKRSNFQDQMVQEQALALPQKLKFGVTTNPEGKNIFQDTNQSYKPILQLQVKYFPNDQLTYRKKALPFSQIKQTFFNFDLEGFLVMEDVKGFSYDDDTMLSLREVDDVCNSVLKIEPSEDEINSNLIECVTQTLDALQIIEKWGKNQEFSQYVRALQEWDEIIGQRWEGSDQRYLSIVGWLRQQSTFKGFKGYVKTSVGRTCKSVKNFIGQHSNLLATFERNRRSNLQLLENNNVQDQGTAFEKTYQMFTQCQEYMTNFLLQRADIFIYAVDTAGLRQELLDNQAKLIKNNCLLYMRLIKERGGELKQWLTRSIQQLTGLIIRIQQFVTLKKNTDRINLQVAEKRQQISILAKLLSLLEGSKFAGLVGKEDKDIVDGLNNLAANLSLTLSDVQNQMPKYVERFKKEIRQSLEKFEKESQQMKDILGDEMYNKNAAKISQAAENLKGLNKKMQNLQIYTKKHREYEQVLEVTEFTNFKDFKELKSGFVVRYKVFNAIIDLDTYAKQWNQWKVMKMEVKQMTSVCDKYMKDLLLAERGISENHALPLFKKKLFVFRDAIPIITALRCPYLLDDDYKKLQTLLKTDIMLKNNEQLTLETFLKLPFQEVQEEILNVATTATQCFYLKRQLDNFENDWSNLQVKLKQFKETSDIIIVYEVEELTAKLDEAMATVSNLLSNRYIAQLRDRAEKLNNQILLAQELIEKLVQCQKKWVYLQNIFAAQDIKKQLMVEAGYFQQADKYLKNLTKKASAKPLITRLLKNTNLNDLTKNLQLLEEIQKKLQDYLQVKRRLFSRFYFISNDQLVEILANSNSMHIVQKHINKLFEGVGSLHIQKQTPTTIEGLISPEGQVVKLVNGVSTRFNIQMWLNNLQKEMIETMKRVIRDGNKDFVNAVQKTRVQWILNHKSQAVLTDNQIIWTNQTQEAIKEQSFKRDSLTGWYELLIKQLQQLTQLIRTDLKPLYHKIAVALITADVHNRDIITNLINMQIQSIHDFAWQQQLKYYIQQNDLCVVRQVTSSMDYGYEYLGATTRLVITPLTDKCWITITSAVANHLGAAPAGPAGTGKTESTKDLAKGLARVCIVFNCSDQITAQMMSKLFSGLAQQGAWTCLDEFNRIDIQVLSVIAQQLFSIRVGLKKEKGEVELQGKVLPIKKNFGVFITMNPGYAGRTQLPDNLKSLFRPVAMMIPDYAMIAEIMLFAQGFQNASELSRKMIQLYKLASQQLSQQKHYDFGLRAVKSLLVMAGELKRSDSKSSEDVVLIKAMKQSNIPKFLQNDIYLFEALVSDLFPSVAIEETVNQKLRSKTLQVISEMKLGNSANVALKVLQLHEVVNIRFGLMIVGEAGVGKTTCYRILKQSMNKVLDTDPEAGKKYSRVEERVVNPKSVTMGELYGQIDLLSQEWSDGLLSSIMRECNNDEAKGYYWITLDGPVDAMWIENLNTVLDDNMTLCLANGERIKLRPQLRMLFEVQNLEAASPATVSRCGMVYIGANNNYIAVIQKGVAELGLEPDLQQHLLGNLLGAFNILIEMKGSWNQPMPTIRLQVAECLVLLIKYLLHKGKHSNSYEQNVKRLNYVSAWAIIWAIGSSITNESYAEFETAVRAQIQNIFLPKTETLFDFFVNPDNLLSFVSWQAKLQEFQFPKGSEYHDIMVPTIDTLKYKYIFEILLENRKPILITGDSGVGKTSLAVPFLFSKREQNVITIFLNFSAKTKPKETQFAIESKLNKKGKTLFGARPNETIAIFIDDINMPELEKEGAQPTIQLLRHFIDYQGFYDRQKLFWKQIVDTTIIGCGATPSGGRNKLNTRYVRHHMILCLPEPSDSNLKKIFGSILKGFLNACTFSENVKKVADGIVLSTLDFYKTIRKELLPIPSKFHYLFNLRDISRVFQGILQCSVDNVSTSERMLSLWAHELERVFGDRLNNDEDRSWFYNYCSLVSKRFTEGLQQDKLKNRYFTKLLSSQTGEPAYEFIDDLKKVVEYLESKIYEYNLESSGKLELVFFKETVQHILKIYRVLSQPRGNAMLIGVGGSGKQSLSKLSSFIANCKISQLQFGKNYGIDSFKTDLQKISLAAGADQTPLCFLFVDTQILYEEFLQSINNLLNTGEVPNLFKKKQEIDDIMNRVRPSALKQKKVDSPESLWSFFIANIRANLHITLCMSPAGDALRVRARKFPSLIDCCTINWFDSWSDEALVSVAQKSLTSMPLAEEQKKKFTELCKNANKKNYELAASYYASERRKVESTPKTYLDQLALFNSILNLKNNQIDASRKILTEGLEKLYSTNDIVTKLKIQMTKLQPKLEEQCVKTEQFLKRLAKEKEEANVVEQEVLAQTLEANEQTLQIKVIKDQAQAQLGKAMPLVLQAEEALKKINKNDITEIKSYANPHPIVLMVLEAVCILLNEKTDWTNIKVIMMDINFLDRLKSYEKNSIPDNILKKLRVYTSKPEFDPQSIGQKNLASKSLSMWCKAIDNYAKIAKEVEPKKRKLAQLEKVFDEKNKVLFMKQKELEKVKEKVAKLQKDCEETLDFKNKLQADLDLTGKRLDRAEKLTNLLKDEGLRWSTMIQGFKTLILQIPGEAFLASIYLSYLGPYTGQYRQEVLASLTEQMKEIDIKYPSNFSLISTLYDQVTIRDWILEGLPNDSASIQNSIIAKKGKRYPLMIDPQLQANKWLKVNEGGNHLSVINFNNTHYLKVLETAVNCGYPVLIEDVQDTLQSSIDSLLEKKIQMVQGLKMTVLGDKKIAIDERFYLYMTSRLANPKFLAEVFNKSTVINFSITFNGLKDQFLSDVCKKEKPEIEQQRDQIIVKVAANKKFLKESQDKILKMLAESKGMVLDDVELITTLEQSKIKSKEVEKSLQENSIVEEQINLARSLFLPTAIRGTILYFVISKLCLIEPMYEFSLGYVKKLYQTGLEKAQFNAMIELKIRRLNESITKIMFTSISRSLFEAHKKLYSFLICCAIKKEAKLISSKEWMLFSRGSGIKPKGFKELLPNPISITPDNWYYLHKLTEIKGLEGLFNDMKGLLDAYLQYFKKPSIFNQTFPGKEVTVHNPFHLLLLSRAFSPENLTFHMSEYVQKELGKYYDQSHVTSIEEVLSGCEYNVPLLFVLSTGVDPTNNILNYCNSKAVNLETISLGQGQGKKAELLIQRSQIDGSWVLLNNCHLSKSWLGDLEKVIGRFSEETIQNKNFRLVLSSMPVGYFPSNILQNADKITLEPPRGIKPNISRSFKQLSEETLQSCPNRKKQWLQCLYSLTFFHALLQQRRKYGPLGFNVRYQFNDSDLEMSLSTLRNFLNDGREDINWDAIWYMIGQINYGGRVTDDLDRICLMSTLRKCLNPDLLNVGNGQKYYYSDSQDYYCLNCHTIEDFQLAIQRVLPSIDSSQVFGLHSNANIAFIIQESKNALNCIQMIQPRQGSSSSEDNSILSIIANLQQLPAPINRNKIPDHLLGDSDKVLPSMTNFLLQEVDKFNNFLNVIDSSLKMLERAIKGAIPMNSDLDQMTVALQNNYLPRIWTKHCYETMKPLASWHVDFKSRVAFLEKCFQEMPAAYWISCFFFPQGLLTAFLQTHARKHKIPIDTLAFKFKATQIEREKLIQPKDGGYIYGLFFEGARYDTAKDTLVDQEPGKLNQPSPTIMLLPVQGYEIGDNQYNCPCYKTSKRSGVLSTTGQSTNFILGVHLNTKTQKSEYWTLKGTALICQLNH